VSSTLNQEVKVMKICIRKLLLGLAAISIAVVSEVGVSQVTEGTRLGVFFAGVGQAEARPARRVARRTSRRTTRRVARRTSIAGCSPYRAYYNCGGVYYQPIQESGSTVYVVVNP
jgi:hypothetical protein